MDAYLVEVIGRESFVILPGFGSLSIADPATGEVTFNTQLKFNDGLLEQFIAQKEKISEQEAQRKVDELIRGIKAGLEKHGEYSVPDLGRFYRDEEGGIAFKTDEKKASPDAVKERVGTAAARRGVAPLQDGAKKPSRRTADRQENSKTEADKSGEKSSRTPSREERPPVTKVSTSLSSAERGVAKKPTSSKMAAEKSRATAADRASSVSPEPLRSSQRKAATSNRESTTTVATSFRQKKTTDTPSIEKKMEHTEKEEREKTQSLREKYRKKETGNRPTAAAGTQVGEEEGNHREPKRKNSRLPLLLLLLALVVGGTVAAYLYRDDLKVLLSDEYPAVASDDQVTSDGQLDKSMPKQEEGAEEYVAEVPTEEEGGASDADGSEGTKAIAETEEESAPAGVPLSTGGNYHVIVGAFEVLGNAKNYVETMKDKGYSTAHIVGKFDQLNLVSALQLDSRSEAASACYSIGDSAWVFKWPR